jgi:hypothetical protein
MAHKALGQRRVATLALAFIDMTKVQNRCRLWNQHHRPLLDTL